MLMNRLKVISNHIKKSSNITNSSYLISKQYSSTMSLPCKDYQLNHTMLRIRNPAETLKFYENNFGMKLLEQMDVPELGFTNYFLGFSGAGALHQDKPWYEREGVLELCHNHGAEKEAGLVMNNGNKEPHRGFGHICFSIDNIQALQDRLLANGVEFQKKLTDGRQKNIAFALDPDGYWIELVENMSLASSQVQGEADLSTIRFNHSMLRIKDPERSLKFYKDVMGMSLLRTKKAEAAKFNLYFLGYTKDPDYQDNSCQDTSNRETMLELTWNYGTETDDDFHYHNGNDQPQGFGHLGVTVPDVGEAMSYLEGAGVSIKKRMQDGKMKFIGFVLDPDGYWIEILPRDPLPEKILSDS